MFGYEFANPEYFWLLLVLIPMIVWYIFKEKRSHADLKFSSNETGKSDLVTPFVVCSSGFGHSIFGSGVG